MKVSVDCDCKFKDVVMLSCNHWAVPTIRQGYELAWSLSHVLFFPDQRMLMNPVGIADHDK